MTTTETVPTTEGGNTQLVEDYDERARKAKLEFEKDFAEKSRHALMFADQERGKGYYEETQKKKDFKQIRVGGAKGKEGRADHTRGKSAFKRPCTVGWKSQNQPLQKGGGNRTPL
mmetsp:Transcript_5316/g.6825  ORF Transcript_5316/g.6825 Transcript_5316/m.6825 type:complete len:115 (+) Transcript_5316:121-465(+)